MSPNLEDKKEVNYTIIDGMFILNECFALYTQEDFNSGRVSRSIYNADLDRQREQRERHYGLAMRMNIPDDYTSDQLAELQENHNFTLGVINYIEMRIARVLLE